MKIVFPKDCTLAPDQYVLSRAAGFPTLYNSVSFEDMKFKVLDQLLNVIGNGIRDNEELAEEFVDASKKFDPAIAARLSAGELMVYGYKKVRTIDIGDGKTITMPERGCADDVIECFASDTHLYPEVKKWVDCKAQEKIAPYPNFSDRYSTVYKTNLMEYGTEWLDACIWFYEKCRVFFTSDMVCHYHGAYPCATEQETARCVEDFKTALARYKSNEEITKAYELEYNGDVEDFIQRRWIKNHREILLFIDKTLELLNQRKLEESK